MKKVLIIGGRGMLGHKLVQAFSSIFETRYTLHGSFETVKEFGIFDREYAIENVDVENIELVRTAIERSEPEVVVNAVGVIKQLAAALDVEKSLSINSIFPHRLARLTSQRSIRLISMSTDCVFAGTRGMYSEQDPPDALDLYGQSKHWGEVSMDNCLTIRTSIIGREVATHNGLVEWFVSQRGNRVNGYSKAVFSGFPTIIFADILIDIIEKYPELCGVVHISSDPISKFDVLRKINSRFRLGAKVEDDPEFLMDRSLDSTRFRGATGFAPPVWDEMIERMYADATPYDKWNDRTN